MKRFLFLFALLSSLFVRAESPEPIVMRPGSLGVDQAFCAVYLEDPRSELYPQQILNKDPTAFQSIERKRANFGFTASTYWVRFDIINRLGMDHRALIEASRAITNEVELYRIDGGKVLDSAIVGDHVPFGERMLPHRKNLFPIELEKGEHASFLLRMKSDGEALIFPLKIWTPKSFDRYERKERSLLGLYYGVLIFVVLIFTFFYFTLRDRSFLYYTLYVLSFAFIQFALDGLAYRYIFPDSAYWADRAVLTTSFITVFLVTLYARSFLRLWEKAPKLDRVYQGILVVAVLGLIGSLFEGASYRYAIPFVNMLSFGGPLFILGSILALVKWGYRVSKWFFLAFLLLITGVMTFLVGNMGMVTPDHLTINGLKFGSLGEVILLSFTMVEKYRELEKEKEQERQNSLEHLQELTRLKDEYNKELEETVEARTSELQEERQKLQDTNQQIMSSIRYAQRIQNAILPPDPAIEPFFRDHFILFRPRDIVSGDIYWFASVTTTKEEGATSVSREISRDLIPDRADLTVFAAMDCTGHGVPGAFLSILGHNTLNRTLKEPTVNSPGEALEFLDRAVRTTFGQADGPEERIEDGMDMGMVALDQERMHLQYAGANNPCYIVRDGELYELKGDKKAIGGSDPHEEKGFSDRSFELKAGDCIYLFSDGYPDQFGGPKGKKFKYKTFKQLLCRIHEEDLAEQRRILEREFDEWKGEREQVDDILVIGVRV